MKVCIDTSAYIAMEHGSAAVADLLAACEEVIVPAATFAELAEGNYRRDNPAKAHIALNSFLDKENVKFVPAGHAISFRYAEIVHSLRRRDRLIPQNDIWIAATAFETGSRVLSYDHHFDEIDGLGRLAP